VSTTTVIDCSAGSLRILAQQLDPVHPRHVEIEQQEPARRWNAVGAQQLERSMPSVAMNRWLVTLPLANAPLDGHDVDLVVVDQQDVERMIIHGTPHRSRPAR